MLLDPCLNQVGFPNLQELIRHRCLHFRMLPGFLHFYLGIKSNLRNTDIEFDV